MKSCKIITSALITSLIATGSFAMHRPCSGGSCQRASRPAGAPNAHRPAVAPHAQPRATNAQIRNAQTPPAQPAVHPAQPAPAARSTARSAQPVVSQRVV